MTYFPFIQVRRKYAILMSTDYKFYLTHYDSRLKISYNYWEKEIRFLYKLEFEYSVQDYFSDEDFTNGKLDNLVNNANRILDSGDFDKRHLAWKMK